MGAKIAAASVLCAIAWHAGGTAADDPAHEGAAVTPIAAPSPFDGSVISPGSVWRTANGESHIRFYDCDGRLCGELVWFANLEREPERAHIDHSNPDPELRGRPLQGIRLLWGFARDGEEWNDGNIYRPRNGQIYEADIRELGEDKIEIRGCKLLFCRKQVWTRVTDAGGAS